MITLSKIYLSNNEFFIFHVVDGMETKRISPCSRLEHLFDNNGVMFYTVDDNFPDDDASLYMTMENIGIFDVMPKFQELKSIFPELFL
jgi:hypothetical protein